MNNFARNITLVLCLLIVGTSLGIVNTAPAQMTGQPVLHTGVSSDDTSEVRWGITPYAWLINLDGTAIVAGNKSDVNVDFFDVIDESDRVLGFMAQFEIDKGEWGLFITTTYVDIQVDDISASIGPLDLNTDVTAQLGWVELCGTRTLISAGEHAYGGAPQGVFQLDTYGGARLTYIELEFDTSRSIFGAPLPSADRDESELWVEPIIGLRGAYRLDERLLLQFRGDVGGFGWGSDFAWQGMATLGYEFRLFDNPAAVFVGYRALSQDYENGSFEWDVVTHGSILGLTVAF